MIHSSPLFNAFVIAIYMFCNIRGPHNIFYSYSVGFYILHQTHVSCTGILIMSPNNRIQTDANNVHVLYLLIKRTFIEEVTDAINEIGFRVYMRRKITE